MHMMKKSVIVRKWKTPCDGWGFIIITIIETLPLFQGLDTIGKNEAGRGQVLRILFGCFDQDNK